MSLDKFLSLLPTNSIDVRQYTTQSNTTYLSFGVHDSMRETIHSYTISMASRFIMTRDGAYLTVGDECDIKDTLAKIQAGQTVTPNALAIFLTQMG